MHKDSQIFTSQALERIVYYREPIAVATWLSKYSFIPLNTLIILLPCRLGGNN